MSSIAVSEVFARWRAAFDEVAALSFDTLTAAERVQLLSAVEHERCRLPAVEHRLIAGLIAESTPAELGAARWAEVLTQRLRIGAVEARRRLAEAQELGPRTTLTGERLEPVWARVAARQAAGQINAEHVQIIRSFFDKLPVAVDYQTRDGCEETLAAVAADQTPEGLRTAAARLAALINPDGHYSDVDRKRRRYMRLGPQDADGLTTLSGLLDPEARATLDAVLAKSAAPGVGNPDDDTPCVDGQPSPEHVQRDTRTQLQRNHDALKAIARSALASGELGQHNGLPATIIVSTTLQELQSASGQAVTGGGSLLPMADVIRLAAHAHHYLAIFDKHTSEPLYLGRTKRLASRGQRMVLHAKDRGCTKPGCTAPGYWCQVHHAERDWKDGGRTDINTLTLACGPHNRLVEHGGWRTRKRKDGRTEWIPPPHLDTGQARVNKYHHPQEYLIDNDAGDNDEDEDDFAGE